MITLQSNYRYSNLKRGRFVSVQSGGETLSSSISSSANSPTILKGVCGSNGAGATELIITAKLTGTVSTTSGDATVTGTGTSFTSELEVGDWVYIDDTGELLKVSSITNDTSFEATANSSNNEASSASGEILLKLSVEASKSFNHDLEGFAVAPPGQDLRSHLTVGASGDLQILGWQ